MGNLAELPENASRKYPGRTAIIDGETRPTCEQLGRAANQVAHALTTRGVRRGDKVAVSCPDLPQFPIVYFGILKAGRRRFR